MNVCYLWCMQISWLLKNHNFNMKLLLTTLKKFSCALFNQQNRIKMQKCWTASVEIFSVLESNQGFQILSLIHNHYDNEVST